MTDTPITAALSRRDRTRAAFATAWAVVIGAAPHVLHHVGPLAGAALLAGATGTAIFAVAGLLLSIPTLRRLYRHTGTLTAPALALAAMTAAFVLSTLVIGPALTGSSSTDTPTPSTMPGHESHHR